MIWTATVQAQTSENPFELTPRLSKSETSIEQTTTNPFEVEGNTSIESTSTTKKIKQSDVDSSAVTSNNPFEITGIKDEIERTNTTEVETTNIVDIEDTDEENPFELIKTPIKENKKTTIIPTTNASKVASTKANSVVVSKRMTNGVMFFMVVLLAVFVTLFRSNVVKSFQAFFNDNIMGQLYREQGTIIAGAYLLLYGMFLINAGIFTYLLLGYFSKDFVTSNFSSLLYCILGVTGLFLLKHFVLLLMGNIFPVEKETKLYNFTITIFGIVLGVFLVPMNILIAYAPVEFVQYFVYAVFVSIGLIYLLRSLRGLFIANRFLLFHKFHFLLYLCTVEIAPLVILSKLLF